MSEFNIDDHEQLVEVFVVVEWRDGAVYKTKSLGKRWVPLRYKLGRNPENPDEFFNSLSTDDPERTSPRRVKR